MFGTSVSRNLALALALEGKSDGLGQVGQAVGMKTMGEHEGGGGGGRVCELLVSPS